MHKSFIIKKTLYTISVIQLLNCNKLLLINQLESMFSKYDFSNNNIPIILDCKNIKEEELDLKEFCNSFKEYKLLPIAIQGAGKILYQSAKENNLIILNQYSIYKNFFSKYSVNYQSILDTLSYTTKLYTMPVRSGQQLINKKGDLIVTSSVSNGAELLACGNIHVYGKLRGRAIAGIHGNTEARIFCYSLEAELISIAGSYCLSDILTEHTGPCQIFLKNKNIRVESL